MKLSTKLVKIKSAIENKSIADIVYNKIKRQVEIHILGYSSENEPIIRVFEKIRDGKFSRQFKTYLVNDIKSISLLTTRFKQTVTKATDEQIPRIILTTYNGTKKEKDS